MTNKKTVLIVDDESHVQHVVAMKLRGAGYEVFTAPNGEIGFQLALSKKPDLVVTDFQMPVMSGFEMSIKLKETAATSGISVLMLTARGHMLADDLLSKTNIRGVMNKPFSPRDLLERVQLLLGGEGRASGEAQAA